MLYRAGNRVTSKMNKARDEAIPAFLTHPRLLPREFAAYNKTSTIEKFLKFCPDCSAAERAWKRARIDNHVPENIPHEEILF
jgi:hypothetical protein